MACRDDNNNKSGRPLGFRQKPDASILCGVYRHPHRFKQHAGNPRHFSEKRNGETPRIIAGSRPSARPRPPPPPPARPPPITPGRFLMCNWLFMAAEKEKVDDPASAPWPDSYVMFTVAEPLERVAGWIETSFTCGREVSGDR